MPSEFVMWLLQAIMFT